MSRTGPLAPRSPLWPVLGLAVFTGLCWGLFDVAARDGLRFGLYVLGFDVIPGCVLFVALTKPERFGLRELGMGWGLGYAVEVLAFILTARLGIRDAFAFYPLVVVLAAGPFAWRPVLARARHLGEAQGWHWGLALVAGVTVAYVVEGYFTFLPLPWRTDGATLHQDIAWNIAMAAEALHHWPPQVPSLAGVPLRYHYFVDVHAAGAAQVTDVSLPVVLLRLWLVPMVILVAVQFVGLVRALGAAAWTGVLGAALLLLVGFADPIPRAPSELLNSFEFSPSFLYGMVVFLPLLTLMCEGMKAVQGGSLPPRWPGHLAVGLVLMAGCAGGKVTILPVFAGGCALCLLAGLVWKWPRPERALLALGVVAALAVAAVFSLTMYRNGSNSLDVKPLQPFVQAQPFALIRDELGGSLPVRVGVHALAGVLGTLKLLLIVAPGILVLALRRRLDAARLLPLGMLLAGLIPIWLLTHPGRSQFYFFHYGYVAALALAAVGLEDLLGGAAARVRWRTAAVAVAVAGVAALALVESPSDDTPRETWPALAGQITYPRDSATLVTPALYDGLRWVERNTSPRDVIAVNHRFRKPGELGPGACYYTAFAERRALAECGYDGSSLNYGSLDGDDTRLRLNDRIFRDADRAALAQAIDDYGVRYLLVDRAHQPANQGVFGLGEQVFVNDALVVVRVGGS